TGDPRSPASPSSRAAQQAALRVSRSCGLSLLLLPSCRHLGVSARRLERRTLLLLVGAEVHVCDAIAITVVDSRFSIQVDCRKVHCRIVSGIYAGRTLRQMVIAVSWVHEARIARYLPIRSRLIAELSGIEGARGAEDVIKPDYRWVYRSGKARAVQS